MKANSSIKKEPLVAVEFVENLQENAYVTLKKCLNKLDAPKAVLRLAESVYDMSYYLKEANDHPERFSPEGFDIQNVIIETVNDIADMGGVFGTSETVGVPRKGSMLDGFEEE